MHNTVQEGNDYVVDSSKEEADHMENQEEA